MKNRIYIVGMGPGKEEMMTGEALKALEEADVIVGYPVYINLLGGRFREKELLSTPMRQEEERCRMCFEKAAEGKQVALICSGDAGVYGLASLMRLEKVMRTWSLLWFRELPQPAVGQRYWEHP